MIPASDVYPKEVSLERIILTFQIKALERHRPKETGINQLDLFLVYCIQKNEGPLRKSTDVVVEVQHKFSQYCLHSSTYGTGITIGRASLSRLLAPF